MSLFDLEYARAAWNILTTSLGIAEGDQPEFYRVAAAQLRLLLCDTTRRHGQVVDISLARRLWPDLRLPALKVSLESSEAGLLLDDWLAQPTIPGGPSLRRLIRMVCDQDGGVHVDPKPDSSLPAGLDAAAWILHAGRAAASALEKRLFER